MVVNSGLNVCKRKIKKYLTKTAQNLSTSTGVYTVDRYPVYEDGGRALPGVEVRRHKQFEVEGEVAQELRQRDPLRQVSQRFVPQAVELDDLLNNLLKNKMIA